MSESDVKVKRLEQSRQRNEYLSDSRVSTGFVIVMLWGKLIP
jgi:hypothetical protein